ncbi:hypothetical protein EI94DRAFT_1705465 [Lactarius quietus]|nr:hypothetical protein EI94DRAFT_1705465 [Lactarius quietus]
MVAVVMMDAVIVVAILFIVGMVGVRVTRSCVDDEDEAREMEQADADAIDLDLDISLSEIDMTNEPTAFINDPLIKDNADKNMGHSVDDDWEDLHSKGAAESSRQVPSQAGHYMSRHAEASQSQACVASPSSSLISNSTPNSTTFAEQRDPNSTTPEKCARALSLSILYLGWICPHRGEGREGRECKNCTGRESNSWSHHIKGVVFVREAPENSSEKY